STHRTSTLFTVVLPLTRPPRPTLFPYTTLFRSTPYAGLFTNYKDSLDKEVYFRFAQSLKGIKDYEKGDEIMSEYLGYTVDTKQRSEEHTSELQSRENLVCRLLLEKKKRNVRENC